MSVETFCAQVIYNGPDVRNLTPGFGADVAVVYGCRTFWKFRCRGCKRRKVLESWGRLPFIFAGTNVIHHKVTVGWLLMHGICNVIANVLQTCCKCSEPYCKFCSHPKIPDNNATFLCIIFMKPYCALSPRSLSHDYLNGRIPPGLRFPIRHTTRDPALHLSHHFGKLHIAYST